MKKLLGILAAVLLCACAQDKQHTRWESLHYVSSEAEHNYCNDSDIACGGGKSKSSSASSINRSSNRGR